MNDYKTVKERKRNNFRRLIDRLGLKQKDVAQAIDIEESNISDMLRGKRTISDRTIGAFCHFFSIDPAEFYVHPETPLIIDRVELEIIQNLRKHPEYKTEIMLISELLPKRKMAEDLKSGTTSNPPGRAAKKELKRKSA